MKRFFVEPIMALISSIIIPLPSNPEKLFVISLAYYRQLLEKYCVQ